MEELIKRDLKRVKKFHKLVKSTPGVQLFFNKITSKHPWQDICLVLWLVFVLGSSFMGSRHVFIVFINLMIAQCKNLIVLSLLLLFFCRILQCYDVLYKLVHRQTMICVSNKLQIRRTCTGELPFSN